MVGSYTVVWEAEALAQLKAAYDYIRHDSPKSAGKVRRDILAKTAKLVEHPYACAADQLRLDGDPHFRYFEIHRYRVAYHVDDAVKAVTILRVRHTRPGTVGLLIRPLVSAVGNRAC